MGLFAACLSSLPEGQPCGEATHAGRVLRQLRLSPQACYPLAEPSAAGGETGAPATSTRPNLRPAHDGGSEVRLGSGRLSLVGTSEGLVAGVDALDSPPLPADVGDGAATAPHQPAQHRLPPARGETEVAAPALRSHQAGDLAEASHPAQDGSLGRPGAGLRRDRLGVAFGQLGCGRFLLLAQSDRSEEHTSELQSLAYLVCRLLLEKKKQS